MTDRRLIEDSLPLAEISKYSAKEKSIRHGHISTLHLWWARRPLAACRAIIFASLVPDPASGVPEPGRPGTGNRLRGGPGSEGSCELFPGRGSRAF